METETQYLNVHGYRIRYSSQYAIETLIKSIFNENDHWFKSQNKRPFIIDAGAHYGCTTMYLKKHFPLAEILCFEPDKRSFAILQDNISYNNLTDVKLFNVAIGDQDTSSTFFSSKSFQLSGGLGNSIVPEWGMQEDEQNYKDCQNVEVHRLSKYIDRPVDYLKLDIEAAEHTVLPEIESKLHFVKRLFMEVHCIDGLEDQQLNAIRTLLNRNNFNCNVEPEPLVMPPWTSQWTAEKKPVMYKLYASNLSYHKEETSTASHHASKAIAASID
jgi:FkbM family methyltransferase